MSAAMSICSARVQSLLVADPLADAGLARELATTYLVWDSYVSGHRRVDLHPLVLSRALHEAAVRAAEETVNAVREVAAIAHREPAERARYRLHPDVLRLTRASREMGDDAGMFRVDLLLGEDGAWHACEINADCPGGHNEALALPKLARAAGYLYGSNPTHVVERLVQRMIDLARYEDQDGNEKQGAVALIFATAYAEDLQVCALLQRALIARGVDAVLAPPTAPKLRNGELWVQGRPVRVLYRYFPAEYMEGQRNLGDIERAIRFGTVRTISSFEHIFTQSKLGFARAWARRGDVSERARAAIDAYLPASFDVRDVQLSELESDRTGWVVKRALGRVGDEVFVGPLVSTAEWSPLLRDIRKRADSGETWIAQRFIRQRTVPSPWGPRYATLGAYVLDGQFAGYFTRVTPETHVSHDAMCVPVFVDGPEGGAS
jgi:glutathionylspermidine synthase